MSERSHLLLDLADDELILGWRDSEWTGIAPTLEEDVAFSSIAQNEIGHARAAYDVLSEDADALAFDREPGQYRSAPLVQLRLVDDWAKTIARRVLYEHADMVRLSILSSDDDPEIRGLARKMDREEVYHRMHATMWADRLRSERRFQDAVVALWPYALGVPDREWRRRWAEEVEEHLGFEIPDAAPVERGMHVTEWPELWNEMTSVRRSAPGADW